jgi:hypothetical protein
MDGWMDGWMEVKWMAVSPSVKCKWVIMDSFLLSVLART